MKKVLNQRFNIGIILLLLATAITNLIAYVTNKDMSRLSDIILVISLICLIDFKSLINFKFYISKVQALLFVYIVIILLFGISVGYSFNNELGSIIYTIFPLFVMIAIFTNKNWKYNSDFPRILFYISGLFTIITTFVISDNFKNIYTNIGSVYSDSGVLISNRLILSTFALMTLISCFCYTGKNKYENILKIIFGIFALLLMMIVSRRGSTVEVIIGIIILIIHNINIRNKKIMRKNIIKNFFIIMGIIFAILVLLHNQDFKKTLDNFSNSVRRAVITLINNEGANNKRDIAASMRYVSRNATISEYMSFNALEILFGKGYMSRNQIDFPLLQIFHDCGIFMGIVYLMLVIVYPLKFVIFKPKNEMEKIMMFFSILTICNSFFTGNPYGINCYMYLIIIQFYYFQNNKESSSESNKL